ncbi:hypothetical protein [Pseudomonas laurentiana]
MDSGNVSAIISAISGISGVLLGNSFVLLKEWWTQRQIKNKDISYAGIILISHLDRLATECLNVARDDGTIHGQPSGAGGEHETVEPTPVFRPLEMQIDWKLLPKEMMYAIIRIPDRQKRLHEQLSSIYEYNYDPPSHAEYFWHRQHGYAVLGLEVSRIMTRLASYAGLPHEKPSPGEWDREKSFIDLIARLDELERKAKGL